MSSCFNLLCEPWIPVLLLSGEQVEMGLAETLARATEIREITDESPLVTVALHRLLLAVLHRAYGPADEAAWERLWRAGRLDGAPLRAYLDRVADRFDLFDPRRPCAQVAGLPGRLASPVARLAPERSTGHQATVWDHHCDDVPAPVSPAQAARWLFSHHLFCVSGSCGDGRRLRGVVAGPLAHAAVFLACGENLLQTLLLNLVPYDPHEHQPVPATADDMPAWERDAPPEAQEPPAGYLDLLTWQPRSICLQPRRDGCVAEAVVMPGRQFRVRRLACDPMLGYLADERPGGAWQALRLRRGENWWRYLARATKPSTARWRRPLVLEVLARRIARGALPLGARTQVAVMGLAGEKARVDLWRRERCSLPVACLRDQDTLADLDLALRAAERAHAILGEHLRRLAQPEDPAVGRPSQWGRHTDCGFWHGLHDAIDALPGRLCGSVDQREEALRWWAACCCRQALQLWSVSAERAAHSRGAWRRRARLQDRLARTLQHELLDPLGGGAL